MSRLLSDYNKNGTIPSVVARKNIYSDLDLAFEINPITNDISPLTDIDAIKNAVKNLVFTNFHERPFNPTLGSGLRALLFENANIFTAMEIKNAIEKVINNNEPRVSNVDVEVVDKSDQNAYEITISLIISFLQQQISFSFFLTRVR